MSLDVSSREQSDRIATRLEAARTAARRLGKQPHRWALIGAVLLCLVPLLWFSPRELVQGADYNSPIYPQREIGYILEGWQPDNLGEPTARQAPRLFPYLTFWAIGDSVGLSTGLTQQLWFVSLFLLAYFSARSLVRLLSPNLSNSWEVALLPLLYVFNPFTVSSWAVGHNVQFLAYACAPLWLRVLHGTLRERPSFTSGIKLAMTSLLFASSFNNPPIIIALIAIPSLLWIAFELISRRVSPLSAITRLAAALPWLAVLNIWWLAPMLASFLGGSGYHYPGASLDLAAWPELHTRIPFHDYMRGLGFWGAYSGYRGVPYLQWAASLSHPLLIAPTVFLISLAFLPLVRRPTRSLAVFACLLALVGIFFSKGVNSPLGDMSTWLYDNVPGFFLMRGTYEKFGGLLFLASLIGASIALGLWHKRRIKNAIAGLTVLCSLAVSWPMLTGAVMPRLNANGVSAVVQIPTGYGELRRWTATDTNIEAILSVPQAPTGYIKTTWGYAGSDFLYNYSEVPVVTGAPDAQPQDGPRFAAFIQASRHYWDAELLRAVGITHVLVRHDVDPAFYFDTPVPETVEKKLRGNGFSYAAGFGDLEVFEVPGSSGTHTDTTFLSFREAFGTTRRLTVDGHVRVVLPQTFDPQWHLHLEPLEEDSEATAEHIEAFDYANAWDVTGGGEFGLSIDYGSSLPTGGWLAISVAAIAVAAFSMRNSFGESRLFYLARSLVQRRPRRNDAP